MDYSCLEISLTWATVLLKHGIVFRKFSVIKIPKSDTINALFVKFQRIGNVNNDRTGNGERQRAQLQRQILKLFRK